MAPSNNWIQDIARRYQQAARRPSTGSDTGLSPSPRPSDRISISPGSPIMITSPFAGQLRHLSTTPLVYENQELLDQALEALPLDRLFQEAGEAETKDLEWGFQDHLIRSLLKWFRNDFFTWVNEPPCAACNGKTRNIGVEHPAPQESANGAGRTEIYQCNSCNTIVRFPRYGHPKYLLTFRKGRCGEWANCFTMLCRALGSRVRWVWCNEDHVWTEIYSEKQKRWIHADSCETAWDQPQLYAQGWGKKMSYIIAFSAEGAVDVTSRYVRNTDSQIARNKIPESELIFVLQDITKERRQALPALERETLTSEDALERAELASYSMVPTQATTEELRPRETGAGDWTEARGESGKR
ncbi:hypothetical protein V1511DRAFT_369174 [Dipodascopsis uninucleata]